MIEEQIKEIKNRVKEIFRQVLAMGEEPPPEIQDLLIKVLEKAQRQVDELRAQQAEEVNVEPIQPVEPEPPIEPIQPGKPIPPLSPAPFPSSNINAFRYDPKEERLFVKFQDKYPFQNGPVYVYEGVPKYIMEVFVRGAVAPKTSGKNKWHRWQKGITPSHGAAMYALIKSGGFPYTKVK